MSMHLFRSMFACLCLRLAFPAFGLMLSLSSQQSKADQNSSPPAASSLWLEVEIGIIGAASADILDSAFQEVTDFRYAGLIIRLDTPGGSLESTRTMVKQMLNAPFPVIVWVGPAGSRAASAGAFITLAGHVAALAPGTNIGAAHPVKSDGSDVGKTDMGKKIEEDATAFMESIAKSRGRNVEMARSFVVTSLSITAEEALKNTVVDFLAENIDEVFAKANGKKITLVEGKEVTLATAGAQRKLYEKSLKQKFLEILSNPNLFYLLFIAGLIGLGFELTHPGAILPGVVGGVCMILALIATSVLPVSFGALLLVLFGVALMAGEIFLPSFGILGIGGFAAFVIGSVLLVDPHNEMGLRISWMTIAPGVAAVAFAALTIGYLVLKAKRSRINSGVESLVGATAVAIKDFKEGAGRVRVSGEDWAAKLLDPTGEQPIAGQEVMIKNVKGLILIVS